MFAHRSLEGRSLEATDIYRQDIAQQGVLELSFPPVHLQVDGDLTGCTQQRSQLFAQ